MKTETNWSVITGAPCAGKTTLVCRLEVLGWDVVHESARNLIETELRKGKSLNQIRLNELEFQQKVLEDKLRLESQLEPEAPVFLDRAIPDSIAYYQLHGLDPQHPLQLAQKYRYKHVFLFERLQLECDDVRIESNQTADKIESLLETVYRNLGYEPIRVPPWPVDRRLAFILDYMD